MLSRIREWLMPGNAGKVRIRFYRYRDQLDLTDKPLLALSGASVESARELIPFLREPREMKETYRALEEIVAYNGEQADEIHAFTNVTQAGAQVARLLVREGRVIEVTLKGW